MTGSTVLGLKYKDGVMLAADSLGLLVVLLCQILSIAFIKLFSQLFQFIASYGSTARYMDVQRLYPVGDSTVLAAGGDISDFQYTKHLLDSLM